MTLLIPAPVVGTGMGWGCSMSVHTDLALPGGSAERAECRMFYIDSAAADRTICWGQGIFSPGSGYAGVRWGLNEQLQFVGTGGADGVPLGHAVSVQVDHRTAAGVLRETATFASYFVWDPVSQLADLLMTVLDESGMLQLIYDCVHKDY